MTSGRSKELVVGECCADFYSHPAVVKLLDGVFHPGGLALTSHLAEKMKLNSSSKVLDLACGDGTTAAFLAQRFGCSVTGLDIGKDMIEKANQNAKDLKITQEVSFQIGISSEMPFDDNAFSHGICECAVCTFYDKPASASELYRAIQGGGFFGMSDVTLAKKDALDDELKGLLGRVACIADALPRQGYIDLFEAAGFNLVESEDHGNLLDEMVSKVRSRVKLGGAIVANVDKYLADKQEDILRILDLIEEQVKNRNISYDLIIFSKR
ncbi:MAG: class I SAM-dependent methyltransferase [Candidatus Thorarchaeota archaeon]|jgi:ubiquinone/menaquinone biosynthesis C-methylase UbiE